MYIVFELNRLMFSLVCEQTYVLFSMSPLKLLHFAFYFVQLRHCESVFVHVVVHDDLQFVTFSQHHTRKFIQNSRPQHKVLSHIQGAT